MSERPGGEDGPGGPRPRAGGRRWLSRLAGAAFLVLLLNAGWLWAFPSANVFYVANVLVHVVAGTALAAAFWFSGIGVLRRARSDWRTAIALSTCAALGGVLCVIGAAVHRKRRG